MKKLNEISNHDINNYSFNAGCDEKPLKELLLQSIISDIDQNEYQKGRSNDFSRSSKQDFSFTNSFSLQNNISNNPYSKKPEIHMIPRTKFNSDNNIGFKRMPYMNDFHQNSNSTINSNFCNNYNDNLNLNNYNYYQLINQNNVYNIGNQPPESKSLMYNNSFNITNNINYKNNNPINNPFYKNDYQNNYMQPFSQFNFQGYDHPNPNSFPMNNFVSLKKNIIKSSLEYSPISSTNASIIEEGLNNIHFSKSQKKFYSDDHFNPANHERVKVSPFIDENKKRKQTNEEYSDVHEILACLDSKLSDYIRTQKGSRNMQKLLNKITPEEIDTILKEIGDSLPELMVDPYSNYFCQKLAQCCSSDQRIVFLKKIQKDFTAISRNKKGTYALQGIIEIINLEDEEKIIRDSIEQNLIYLSLDNNGTHVIQKLILCIDEDRRDYINNHIISNLVKLVLDPNGICIAKSFIAGNVSLEIRKRTIEEIILNCLEILQNPFGNYVIQEVFEKWGFEMCKEIVKIIHHNIISLSMQKYSSNVVEKSIEISNQATRKKVLKDLLNSSKITSLLKNKFGNFVLQKAITFIKQDEDIHMEIKENISKKINCSNNKDKIKFSSLLEML